VPVYLLVPTSISTPAAEPRRPALAIVLAITLSLVATGCPNDGVPPGFARGSGRLEAEQMLMAAQLTKKRRRERLDMLAAQLLLTAWLEAAPERGQEPGALDD